MRKFRSPDQWRQILKDQQQSDLTISEYCRQHDIPVGGLITCDHKKDLTIRI